jgi:hypothetical protein
MDPCDDTEAWNLRWAANIAKMATEQADKKGEELYQKYFGRMPSILSKDDLKVILSKVWYEGKYD